jgi:hypothetical protein
MKYDCSNQNSTIPATDNNNNYLFGDEREGFSIKNNDEESYLFLKKNHCSTIQSNNKL